MFGGGAGGAGGRAWPASSSGGFRDHSAEEAAAVEDAIRGVIADELGRDDLPIVANLPFGHTDPQWVLPIGVRAELDVDARRLRLVEPWLA